MKVEDLLDRLKGLDCRIEVVGENLKLSFLDALPFDVLNEVKRRKPEIIRFLTNSTWCSGTVQGGRLLRCEEYQPSSRSVSEWLWKIREIEGRRWLFGVCEDPLRFEITPVDTFKTAAGCPARSLE